MTSRRTTHELAGLLQDVANALRQLPDMPLSELKPQRARKTKPSVDTIELATLLPQLSKEEARSRLNKLDQKSLTNLCKELKVNVGSKRTKSNLTQQVLWQLFDANDELEHIRTYEETPR